MFDFSKIGELTGQIDAFIKMVTARVETIETRLTDAMVSLEGLKQGIGSIPEHIKANSQDISDLAASLHVILEHHTALLLTLGADPAAAMKAPPAFTFAPQVPAAPAPIPELNLSSANAEFTALEDTGGSGITRHWSETGETPATDGTAQVSESDMVN